MSFPTQLNLPTEIYDFILKDLPIEDLASVSLVSRTWQAHAFPHLYKTAYLCLDEHLKQFAERLAADDGHGPFSISANMKGLVLYDELRLDQHHKTIQQDSLEYLKTIVPRLPRLKHLSWELRLVPDDLEIFPLFQRRCPSLDSIHLFVFNPPSESHDTSQYRALFNFTELTHISIRNVNQHQLTFVGQMLTASPNLVSLKLDVAPRGRTPGFPTIMSPDEVLNYLGDQFTFTSLRSFHLQGGFCLYRHHFFTHTSSPTSPLRSFFERHPAIQDLGFNAAQSDAPHHGKIQPMGLSQLFPSLKHFRGPAFLCRPLVRSPLAEQLETLNIFTTGTGGRSRDDLWMIGKGAKALPNLRRLAASDYSTESEPAALGVVSALRALLQASPLLEMLETRVHLDDYPLFIELLKQSPRLKRVEFNASVLLHVGKRENSGGKFELISRLARICPCLETVCDITGDRGKRIYNVSRGADGSIDLWWVDQPQRMLSSTLACDHMLNRLSRTFYSAVPLAGLFSRSSAYVPPQLSMASSDKVEVATFASGCYWGTEHIFVKHYGQKGILKTAVGFTGGNAADPTYRQVCNGNTGHAEACRVEFDPEKVGYAELVEFFYRTHNPTTLNRQGNDVGTQYRSAIFTHSPEQDRIARQVTADVQAKHFDPKGLTIVTAILPAGEWWSAHEDHQMYLFKNPNGYQCETHRLHW